MDCVSVSVIKPRGFSSAALKLIAAAAMLCDHICVILFPGTIWLRWIGRLSMPIFAYLTAEGLRHTSDRKRYIGRVAALGVLCQAAFVVSGGDWKYVNVILTYAMTLAVISLFDSALGTRGSVYCGAAFVSAALFLVLLMILDFSYGFIVPAITASAYFIGNRRYRFIAVTAALLTYSAYCASRGYGYQAFSLFAVPVLVLYDGRKGAALPKYFFYVFYPAHLALLWLIRYFLIKN